MKQLHDAVTDPRNPGPMAGGPGVGSIDSAPPGKTSTVDPVCGMKVDLGRGPSLSVNGVTYGFCCEGCRETFRSNPAKYRSAETEAPQALAKIETATAYTCPMHPEVRQSRPGPCPKCGMA